MDRPDGEEGTIIFDRAAMTAHAHEMLEALAYSLGNVVDGSSSDWVRALRAERSVFQKMARWSLSSSDEVIHAIMNLRIMTRSFYFWKREMAGRVVTNGSRMEDAALVLLELGIDRPHEVPPCIMCGAVIGTAYVNKLVARMQNVAATLEDAEKRSDIQWHIEHVVPLIGATERAMDALVALNDAFD